MPKSTRQLSDAELKDRRLVFYSEDVESIDAALRDFLGRSKSKAALLVDKDGHMITKEGNTEKADTDTVSALVAGCFAATREMARILGEEEFTALFHQGKRDNIQLSLVGHRTILAVLFDEGTTIGMVRLYASETARKLNMLFRKIASRSGGNKQELDATFHAAASDSLNDFFSE